MIFLIATNLFWALAALVVDLPKLLEIPFFLWPIVAICPIYPFLLALVFLKILRGRPVNGYLLAFASFGSAVFGVLAIIYYPYKMFYGGFNWIDLGQIFWVLFYALQGWYLLLKKRQSVLPLLSAFIFLFAKFIVDYRYLTFGYLDVAALDRQAFMMIFAFSLISSVAILIFAFKINSRKRRERVNALVN